MTGYELRIWRKHCKWTQGRAAEELGVSLRTYQVYEKMNTAIPVMAQHAVKFLELRTFFPELAGLPADLILVRLCTLLYGRSDVPAKYLTQTKKGKTLNNSC